MTDVSISEARNKYDGSHIDDDLLLFDEISNFPFPSEPRRLQCIFVGLCLKGKAQYSVNTEDHIVKANDAIIINEGQVTDNYMVSRDFSGIAIMMSDDFFHEIIKGMHELSSLFLFSRNHPVFTLTTKEVGTLINYFHLIKQKVDESSHHFRKDLVSTLMAAMIYDLSNVIYRIQQMSGKKRTRAEGIFTDFIKLVEQNYRSERRVSWYGEQLCITPKYLSETVKQVSRRTPIEWIDNYVTLEVRVLLKNSTMSIKEIAHKLNFPNQSFFGKFFKEHVGVSPSKYRRM